MKNYPKFFVQSDQQNQNAHGQSDDDQPHHRHNSEANRGDQIGRPPVIHIRGYRRQGVQIFLKFFKNITTTTTTSY